MKEHKWRNQGSREKKKKKGNFSEYQTLYRCEHCGQWKTDKDSTVMKPTNECPAKSYENYTKGEKESVQEKEEQRTSREVTENKEAEAISEQGSGEETTPEAPPF